jgi:hypothetical protein
LEQVFGLVVGHGQQSTGGSAVIRVGMAAASVAAGIEDGLAAVGVDEAVDRGGADMAEIDGGEQYGAVVAMPNWRELSIRRSGSGLMTTGRPPPPRPLPEDDDHPRTLSEQAHEPREGLPVPE